MKSLSVFSKHFVRSFAPQRVNKSWINLLKATILIGGFHQYSYYKQRSAHCSFFQSSKFNYHSAAKSTVIIYKHNQDHPVASGIIVNENGLCISIANIYPKVSEERLEMEPFYAKVLGDDQTYAISFVEHLNDDNLVLFSLIRRDPDIRFQPAKFSSESAVGHSSYAIGKSENNFTIIESGIINEVNFNAKLSFGKGNDTNSFNIMCNIPNRYTTLFGGPLFDESGKVLGLIIPYEDKLLPTHLLATPYSFLEGILKQYNENGRVRRPYLGMSIKSSASGTGAFVIKLNSDGPASMSGIKLGDTIVEINDQKITNNIDFFKCLGYTIGQHLKMKVERNGKYIIINTVSS